MPFKSVPIIQQTYSFDTEMAICNEDSLSICEVPEDDDLLDISTASEEVDVEVQEDGTIWIIPHVYPHLNPHTKRQLLSATIAGAFAGCMACGPLVGIPMGAGTAALAVSSESRAGEWTRKGGDMLADAGEGVGHRIRNELEDANHRYHNLADQTKDTAVRSYQWTSRRLREIEQEHHLVDKTKKGMESTYQWANKRFEPCDSPRARDSPRAAIE